MFECLDVKPVRELDAGDPHVQFDERVAETDLCQYDGEPRRRSTLLNPSLRR